MNIYAMSDIHGCLQLFDEALRLIDLSGDNKLILCGDYIHGRQDNYGVLDRIIELERNYGSDKVIVHAGNHEDMACDRRWPIGEDYMAKIDENARVNIETDITFRELRNYLSVIDRLSICMLETLSYNNYICLEDVPHTYDGYYVYGIGMIESEFYKIDKYEYAASGERKDLTLVNCIEIMLSEEPKSVLIKRDREKLRTENLMLLPGDNVRDNAPFLKMLREDGDFRFFSGVEPTEKNVLNFQNYFEREKCCFYAIFPKDCPGEMIGYVGISYREEERTEAEFYISKPYRGKGYCTEALHKICEEASQGNLKWRDEKGKEIRVETDRLYATTISDNLAAVKVLEKCGFVENKEMVLISQIFIDPDNEDIMYENEVSDYVFLL